MTTPDAIRERISRESQRGRMPANEALIHRDHLEITERLEARIAQLEAAIKKPCAECARRFEWATGAKA